MAELTKAQKKAMALARVRAARKKGHGEAVWSGSVLPISEDAQGRKFFDPNAGVIGTVKRAVTLPGDVYQGKVDPTSQEGIERAFELGTIASPVSPASRAIRAPAAMQKKPKPPSREALKEAGVKAFKEAREEGVEYSVGAVDDLANAIRAELHEKGLSSDLAPRTFKLLDDLQSPPDDAVGVPFSKGLDAARKRLRRSSSYNPNFPEEQPAASITRRRIMDFIENPPDQSVVVGTPATARKVGSLSKEGAANYAAAKRSEMLTGIQGEAELRAAAANSGRNIGNTQRSKIASLLLNPKRSAGFSEAEKIALERVVQGTQAQNRLRDVGNLLGGGGGLGALATGSVGGGIGAMAGGGPVGAMVGAAAPIATGMAAKAGSNALTGRMLRGVDALTRSRSPLAVQQAAQAPVTAITPGQQSALIRALLMSEMSGGRY